MTQILPNLLLNNVSVDGVGNQITIPDSGWRVIKVDGNLGGGGITLQTKGNSNDSEFLDVPDPTTPSNPYTVLSPTQFRVYLGSGMIVQATLAGSSGASGVYVRIF